jgi:CheY-like chemotaxis protein
MDGKDQSSSQHLIFAVDDDDIFLDTMVLFLEKCEHQVKRLDSGSQAIELCETLMPDLILMDAVMPGIDGFSACQ